MPSVAPHSVIVSMARKAAELYERLCTNTDPEVAKKAYGELYENAWLGFQDDYDSDIKKVNCVLFNRYLHMCDSVYAICNKVIEDADAFTLDKHSRWLGYVQGVLVTEGYTTVAEERDFSRPLFQEVYEKYNIEQDTIGV